MNYIEAAPLIAPCLANGKSKPRPLGFIDRIVAFRERGGEATLMPTNTQSPAPAPSHVRAGSPKSEEAL